MFERYLATHNVRRFERLLASVIDPSRRRQLEALLDAQRLKLLAWSAGAVDPARLFHGVRRKSDRRFG